MKKNSLLVILNDYSEQVLQGRKMKKVYFQKNKTGAVYCEVEAPLERKKFIHHKKTCFRACLFSFSPSIILHSDIQKKHHDKILKSSKRNFHLVVIFFSDPLHTYNSQPHKTGGNSLIAPQKQKEETKKGRTQNLSTTPIVML